jgi:hypothetical protein
MDPQTSNHCFQYRTILFRAYSLKPCEETAIYIGYADIGTLQKPNLYRMMQWIYLNNCDR